MLFKIPVLVGLIYLHNVTKNALICASIWSAFVLVSGLLQEGFDIWVFVYVAISFLLSMGYFSLLEYFHENLPVWIMSVSFGAVVLVLLT